MPHRGMLRALRVLVHPVPRCLLECSLVVLELVRNTRLDRIIRLRSGEDSPDQREHVLDLVRRLPLVGTQHAQAHSTTVIVGDVGVVDLGLEADRGRLEGVVFGQGDVNLEVTTLGGMSVLLFMIWWESV